MADDKIYNVLFLDVRNAARSIMAEKVLDRYGGRRFKDYSGGSNPADRLHPFTIDIPRTRMT